MFHHRSSSTTKASKKQQKSSKTGEGRTPITKVNTGALSKQDRVNTLRQMRQAKREEMLDRRRMGAGNRPPPPKVVVIVGFHEHADTLSLKRRLLSVCTGEDASTAPAHVPATVVLPDWAKAGAGGGRPRVLFIDPPRDLIAVLDVVKCADLVVCVLGPHASLDEPAFDDLGYRFLTALKSQGLPVTVGAIHGTDASMSSTKKSAESRKFINRYFASELGAEAKLFPASTDEEVKALARGIVGCTPKEVSWRSDRAYLLAQDCEYRSEEGLLALRGYVRGPGFCCKHIVHLTGHGDFALARLSVVPDPCPVAAERKGAPAPVEKTVDELKEEPDLQRLQLYDPSTAEQTWPTDDEMAGASASAQPKRRGVNTIPAPEAANVPVGDDDEGDDGMDGDEGEEAGADDMEDDGEDSGPDVAPSAMGETDDGWEVSSNMTGAADAPTAALVESEKRRRELIKRSEEELEFPDEVDTPIDVPAKERFQKYRGLKSFRTSAWDPYEDLPVAYSRIWEFEAFNSTGRAFKQQYWDECEELVVGAEGEDTGTSTLFCTLILKGVPPSVMELQPRGVPFLLSSLLPCEQKVSVVQGTVTRFKEYSEPIKSKQELWMHCGFRRFMSRPIFSEIPKRCSSNKKHKFMRFLQPEGSANVSMYAPVMFPPCRLLMFANTDGGPELIGAGSILGADPKQLVIKRVCLTGYPFKVHKSKSVVRFMFFSPADIRWFKPVELSTKKGLRGHIVESVGTHGYMKCRFNGHIKQDDTVVMNLYKRVYPKWYPPSWGGRAEDGPEEA
jgi:pre-rRNA-processing protein TSR1